MERTANALNQTLYAQTYSVLLEMIEAPHVVKARGVLLRRREEFRKEREEWSQEMIDAAGEVFRSFEGAGTIVSKKLLPIEYVNSWTLPIWRSWEILKDDTLKLRKQRNDPFLGREFEDLANEIKQFLPN
jgi:hypothetical protein